ncbi:MAG: XRE family transcriptional regulator [Ruminococcaceae bacterium]|nr:XRE family transcriptional regulator [Oscillospiraceae bacterium]
MFDKKLLGNNIKRERERHGMTQSQLAEKLYLTYQSVSGWERGTHPPDLDNICELSKIFGISIDTLLFKRCGYDRYMVAVDGGGSKTEFVLFTESGEVIRREKLSSSNPNSGGAENCISVLLQGIERLRSDAYKIDAIFVGIAGGASSVATAQIVRTLQEKYGSCSVSCDSDTVNVLGFAPDPLNAMGMIVGTGSSVFFRNNGLMQYTGGWGYLFDKGGSGFDIGRDAIREALSASDGMKDGNEFVEIITSEIGEARKNLGELYRMNVQGVASLAPVVFRAAGKGNKDALSILERNAGRMAELIKTAQKKSGYKGKIIGGGSLLRDAIYKDMIQEKSGVEIMVPEIPPIYGAAVECCLRNGIKTDESFGEKFAVSYKRRKQENAEN